MKIIGHQKQFAFLKRSTELGKAAHAYLFSGQEKLGKKTLAIEWASLITGQPFREHHPDFVLVEAKDNKIQISQIRDLIWRLSLKPAVLSSKIAIIDNAHLMGIDAQHALLKTLEEPKGDSMLILITDRPESLFPTIRSRCETVKFYPVQKTEILNYLKQQNIYSEKAEEIAVLSRGRPGEAIKFALNPNRLKERKRITEELDKISASLLYRKFQYAQELSQKENLIEVLEIWLSFLRTKLIEEANEVGIQLSSSRTKEKLNLLQELYSLLLTRNINPKLALENLFIKI